MDRDGLVDIGVLSLMYGIPQSTLRRWAHEGRYERQGTDIEGRALYRLSDAIAVIRQTRPAALLDQSDQPVNT